MVEDLNLNHKKIPSRDRTRIILIFSLFLILIALGWLGLWFFYFQYHEKTDDAYANGNLIPINSAISGSLTAFFADDTDYVQEGQLLATLDCTEYQITYEKELATLSATTLEVIKLYDQVDVYRATVTAKQSALAQAQYDYANRLHLVDSGAISNEDFVHSKDTLLMNEAELKQAESQLQVSLDAMGTTPLEKHPLIEEQKARVRAAYIHLQHCAIYAPATGYIAKRSAEVGQWVTPATSLMVVIPTNYVWVDANFKETQLRYMRIGQPARVWFDLYGSKIKYEGEVLGIASGTGSVFSLIPPQNATGNWIKIVQRLPVRISLNSDTVKQYPIRIGISAEVDVNITEKDLPMLSTTSFFKPIGITNVFDIPLNEIDQIMDTMIQELKTASTNS